MDRDGTGPGVRSLSICVPTHHGRAEVLAQALESVGRQAATVPDWSLEVCVSDNGSRDGTAAVVRRFERESGVAVTYRRNERDLGLGRNILSAVRLARGRWCWPIGSDDELAADALLVMTRLLQAHPEATAVAQPRANFSADMATRLEPDRPEFYPLVDRPTVYRGAESVTANLGHSWAYLGCQVLRRDRLLEAAAAEGDAALAHPVWPQVYLMGRLAERHPTWVWYPTPLVKSRADNSFYTARARGRRDLAEIHVEVIAGLVNVWNALFPRRGPVHRELMHRTCRVWAGGEVVRVIKSRPDHGIRQDVHMARGFIRRLWRLRELWTATLPALAVPAPVQRRLAAARRRARGRLAPLSPVQCRTTISARVPSSLPARQMARVRCTVSNRGPARLASADPNPVHLSYRWFDGDEAILDGFRTELAGVLEHGETTECELRVLTPWDPGTYDLRLAPVQENVAWFDDIDPSNGACFAVSVSLAPVPDAVHR